MVDPNPKNPRRSEATDERRRPKRPRAAAYVGLPLAYNGRRSARWPLSSLWRWYLRIPVTRTRPEPSRSLAVRIEMPERAGESRSTSPKPGRSPRSSTHCTIAIPISSVPFHISWESPTFVSPVSRRTASGSSRFARPSGIWNRRRAVGMDAAHRLESDFAARHQPVRDWRRGRGRSNRWSAS